MNDFLELDVDFSNYHLVFPIGIGAILVALLVIIGAKSLVTGLRSDSDSPRQGFRLFDREFDWRKLFGALACLFVYVVLLTPLGFLLSSILFIVAISFVFNPTQDVRVLGGIAASAVCTPLAIWLVFGQLFNITLP